MTIIIISDWDNTMSKMLKEFSRGEKD